MRAFLDTHAAVFLFDGQTHLFGAAGRKLLSRAEIRYSPAVGLELALLHERGRLTVPPEEVLGFLGARLGVMKAADTLAEVVDRAMGLSWTRDPFDRMIAAHALLHEAPLITRDRVLLANCPGAVW